MNYQWVNFSVKSVAEFRYT